MDIASVCLRTSVPAPASPSLSPSYLFQTAGIRRKEQQGWESRCLVVRREPGRIAISETIEALGHPICSVVHGCYCCHVMTIGKRLSWICKREGSLTVVSGRRWMEGRNDPRFGLALVHENGLLEDGPLADRGWTGRWLIVRTVRDGSGGVRGGRGRDV